MTQAYNANGAGDGGRRVNFRGLEFDPDIPLLAGPLTDWADFVPGIQTGGGVVNIGAGSKTGKFRIVGTSADLVVLVVFGAGLAIGAGTLELLIADTGYAPDATKCIDGGALGVILPSSQAEYHDASTAANDVPGWAFLTGSVNLALVSGPGATPVTAAAPYVWAAGDSLILRATVPVVPL